MSDIVERLDAVLKMRGNTWSSEEVMGMLAAAKAEIERLRTPDGTYAALLDARAKVERLTAALRAVVQERRIDIARAALEGK